MQHFVVNGIWKEVYYTISARSHDKTAINTMVIGQMWDIVRLPDVTAVN